MSAATLAVLAVFVVLAGLALRDYARHRDRARLDVALMFGALALVALVSVLAALGVRPAWLAHVGSAALLAQPYLLVRLVAHFRPVPAWVSTATLVGLLAVWLVLALGPDPLAPAAGAALALYFVLAAVYPVVAFVRGAVRARGVTRWRLMLAAAGSALLAAVIAEAGLRLMVPALAEVTQALSLPLAGGSALAYYAGFAPPRWLRRAWQLPETHAFLREATRSTPGSETAPAFDLLCRTADRVVGGAGALVGLPDAEGAGLVVRAATLPGLVGRALNEDGPGARAWREGVAVTARATLAGSGVEAEAARTGRAAAVLAVPIVTRARRWGVLKVFVGRGALFVEDDLDLLSLLADETGLALDHAALLAEQSALVQQLEAAVRELDAFSYSVSHDLRAPLRAVDGFSRILLEEQGPRLDAEARHHLEVVRENAQQMGRLIDDLLAFSRLSRQPVARRPVAVDELVRGVLAELAPEKDGRRVEVVLGDLPPCHADAALLKQVYANLLSNALKYTRKRPEARLEVGSQPADGGTAYFVRDNGVGFDMRYAGKLFGVFQRLHRAEDYEGTGVGLAIVQRVVNRHGGRVWAEAAPDRGAAFYFTLGEAA